MNTLQIMGSEGHREVKWDLEKVGARDPEALAAVAEAERILEEAIAHGHLALVVEDRDQPALRIERFDQTAKQPVIVPRLVGG